MLRKLLAAACAVGAASAFYIPGYSIKSYQDRESIPLFVNKIYSDNSQLQYAWYDLPFVCPPSGNEHGGVRSGRGVSLNLGEVLRGDRIMTSDYDLTMGVDKECQYLCTREMGRSDLKRTRALIEDGYVAEWIVDNLPGATSFVTVDRSQKYYAAGFKVGSKDISTATGLPKYYIHNHLTLVMRWRTAPGRAGDHGGKVIVGFEVYTKSIAADDYRYGNATCPEDLHHTNEGLELFIRPNNTLAAAEYADSSYLPEQDDVDDGATLKIPYSYSVYFREDKRVDWANRWDMYFNNQEESSRIHWLAIFNAAIIAGLLTTIVAMIWNRTVHGDMKMAVLEDGKSRPKRKARSSGTKSPRVPEKAPSGLLEGIDENDELSSDDESVEDTSGWKLLHGDVFRIPPYAGLFAPLVGSGCQLVFMAAGLLGLSAVGVLNPSWRGGFASVGMGLFVFAGMFSGYFSGRVYKTFNGVNWRKNTLMTALLFPGLVFSSMFVLNMIVWARGSSTALPFGTLVGVAALWLLIQTPLVYAGSWVGYRSKAWEHPTKTTSIPRQIPPAAWYLKPTYAIAGAGLLPFAVIFIELLFVFRSLWQDKSGYYYDFGFLTVVSAVLILTVVEVTIVATYIQLCAENHQWWWQSFLIGGSSSVWIFLYCTWFYFVKLNITGFVSAVLFFSYSALACTVYGLLTGTVGFLTAYAFVRRIYGAIKID